jgi:23S rRNA (adenine2503-C2)-methyltransferase
MLKQKIFRSALDKSVNWSYSKNKGHLETRYVRRKTEYIAAYVSSHNGCTMGCKMCFLTQLNQNWFSHTKPEEFKLQFDQILDYYDSNNEERATRVNLNFMARGEPLANKYVLNNYPELYQMFKTRAEQSKLELKSNVSTIMPHTVRDRKLSDIFCGNTEIYYSLYSIRDDFRKEWLPNAIHYREALDKLLEFQQVTSQPITFHWTFIKGKNDSIEEVEELVKVVKPYNFFGKFNIVRYNAPPGLEDTEEPSDEKLNRLLNILREAVIPSSSISKVVPRVGKDVHASCGMFFCDNQ